MQSHHDACVGNDRRHLIETIIWSKTLQLDVDPFEVQRRKLNSCLNVTSLLLKVGWARLQAAIVRQEGALDDVARSSIISKNFVIFLWCKKNSSHRLSMGVGFHRISSVLLFVLATLVSLPPATNAQDVQCHNYQQLLFYYNMDNSLYPSCGPTWYFWENGTCYYDENIQFINSGQSFGFGNSAMFIANLYDPYESS
jgi:hypothetical protein